VLGVIYYPCFGAGQDLIIIASLYGVVSSFCLLTT
jgi:hypothetical protein